MTNSSRDGGGDASVLNLAHSRHVEKESAYKGTVEDIRRKWRDFFFIPASWCLCPARGLR